MRRMSVLACVGVVCLLSGAGAQAQRAVAVGERPDHGRLQAAPESPATGGAAVAHAPAQIPRLIKFSGALRDLAGKPLAGAVDVTFSLYKDEAGGAALWFEAQTVEADSLGRYTALLGAMSAQGLPMELFATGEAHWLGVQVANLPEQPRVLLVSVPYALKAGDAETLGGKPASAFVEAPSCSGDVSSPGCSVGQITSQGGAATSTTRKNSVTTKSGATPQAAVTSGATNFVDTTTNQVVGVTQNGTGMGLSATAASNTAVQGVTTSGTFGVQGQSASTSGRGVSGVATATTGTTFGVQGVSSSPSGAGVRGDSTATTGVASGVVGVSASSSGIALFGEEDSLTGNTKGIFGKALSTSGVGLHGEATAASGATTGILGRVFSAAGTALAVDNTQGGKLLSARVAGVEKLVVDGSGNLGVGTSSPSFPIHVVRSDSTGTGVQARVSNTSTATNSLATFSLDANGGAVVSQFAIDGLGTGPLGAPGGYLGTFTGHPLGFVTGNAVRMMITSAGEVDVLGNLALNGTFNTGLVVEPNATSPNVIAGFAPAVGACFFCAGNLKLAGVVGAAIGGGGKLGSANIVTDDFGTIGGGEGNQAGDNAGTTSDQTDATVGGGFRNKATMAGSTVGGGISNTASGSDSTVGGGFSNTTSESFSTVGGGINNQAPTNSATVAGGDTNVASGTQATVSGGRFNTASGSGAMIPGGSSNTASGAESFAAGLRAKAAHDGAFVWAGNNDFDFASTTTNQFRVRSTGGAQFVTGIDGTGAVTAGVFVAGGGGSWASLSDRNAKQNFAPVEGRALLARLNAIPVLTWNYKSQKASIRHMGPVAQDFYAAFGLGEDDKHITTVDEGGVALAGIQALYRQSLEKDEQIRKLSREVEQLRQAQEQMMVVVARLDSRLRGNDRAGTTRRARESATRRARSAQAPKGRKSAHTEIARVGF